MSAAHEMHSPTMCYIADMASGGGEERDVKKMEGGGREAKGRRSMVHNPGTLHLLQVAPDRILKFLCTVHRRGTGYTVYPAYMMHFAHFVSQGKSYHPLVFEFALKIFG